MKKITLGAVALGIASSVVMAGPAMAATYDGSEFDLGNVTYDGLNGNAFSVADTWASDAWMTANPQWGYPDIEYQYLNTNWDGVAWLDLTLGTDTLSYEGGVDCDKVDDGTDAVVTCPVETLHGIDAHPEIRYYDSQMMTRVVWFLENKTSADITVTPTSGFESECDGSGLMETSAGDSGEDATSWDMNASTWSVQRGTFDDGNYVEACGIEIAAWQSPDAGVKAETILDSNLDGQDMTYDALTVKAGQTIALAYFFANAWVSDENEDPNTLGSAYQVNRLAAFDTSVDWAAANLASWTDTLATGLPSDLYVANWMAAAPSTLPDTGVDAAQAGILAGSAALLALVGAGVVVAMRRRANA